MKFSRLILPFLILLLSAAAALVGTGLAYHRVITPLTSLGELQGIRGDRWIEDGARISLRDLSPRGNKLSLHFSKWHPQGLPPAQIRASVCGRVASEFAALPGSKQTIHLTGPCNPRVVSLTVLNPFVPSATDTRRLGAQLLSMKVTSRLGVPVLGPGILLPAFLTIFALAIAVYGAFRGPLRLLGLTIPALAVFFLQHSAYMRFEKSMALWLLAFPLFLGMILARRVQAARPPVLKAPEAIMFAIVIAGALLRAYGLEFGLPANYHPDEVPKFNAISNMINYGDLNPRYFLHPSLLLYSTYFADCLFRFIVQLTGLHVEWQQTLIFSGRLVSMTAGTLSIYLVYLIGKRLYSAWTGSAAAAFLAFSPLHVTCSRYVKEDALLVFVTLLCILTLIKAVQEDKKGLLLLAGFLAGASASVKYTGMLSLGVICMAPWLKSKKLLPDGNWLRWTAAAAALAPIGFLVFTPYSVLDPQIFYRDFMHEKNHMQQGHTILISAWSQFWMYHFHYSILPGLTRPLALVAAAGLGLLLWRRRTEDLMMLALLLLFYLPAEWVKAKPAPQPERYILPCLPILAIAAAELLRLLSSGRRLAWGGMLAAGVLAAFPAVRAVQLAQEVRQDTRAQMAAWMRANLPRGASVYVDWKPYSPHFPGGEFKVIYLPRSRILPNLDVRDLRKSGVDYLIMSSLFYSRYFVQPEANPAYREQIRSVFTHVPVVQEFRPRYGTYGFHNPTLTLFSLKEADFARLEKELELQKKGELVRTGNELLSTFPWRTGERRLRELTDISRDK